MQVRTTAVRYVALAFVALALVLLASTDGWAIPKGNARIAVDAYTGEVLVARGSLTRWHPASLTKMMTLYLLFDALERGQTSMDDTIVLSRHAARQPPSRLGLGQGGRILVRDAIQVLAVKSANDIAVAVAEHLAGSEVKFAAKMNRMASRLGMKRTNFRNASGLHHSQQVTTARDMAILAVALMRDFPQYYHVFSQQRFRYGRRTYTNTNHMLGTYDGMDGVKTGYIYKAGFNLAASVKRGDRRVVAVVMGANSTAQRTRIMKGVLDDAFAKLRNSRRQYITAGLPVRLRAPPPVPRPRPGAPGTRLLLAGAVTPSALRVATASQAADVPEPPEPPERVVASAPIPPPDPLLVSVSEGAGTADLGKYSVQIGAFRNMNDATRMLTAVMGTLPQDLGDPDPMVARYRHGRGDRLYRARLVGYETRDEATLACNWLKSRKTDCLVVAATE